MLKETEHLLEVVRRLRKECPWDRKQTHTSLIPYLIEEAYETRDAIENGKSSEMREELGDLLLQIVLHSVIAEEKRSFTLETVASGIADKMIRRHPHIFDASSKVSIETAEDQTKNWSKIKGKERPERSLLAGLPRSLPALQRAQRYGDIAASVGFDWTEVATVLDKVDEELAEVRAEIKRKPQKKADLELELGDLLFVLTRLAAHLKLDAEQALRKACDKFETRFQSMESALKKKKKPMAECSLDELEALWKAAKRRPSKTGAACLKAARKRSP